MADRDDLPYIVIERGGASAGSFVWGALLGAAAALLLTPRTGAQTQEEIRRGVGRFRTGAEDRVDDARGAVTDAVQRTRDRMYERVASVRDTLESRTDQARQAVEAGRRAAREARAELERRIADAKGGRSAWGSTGDMAYAADGGVEVVITEVTVEEDIGEIPLA